MAQVPPGFTERGSLEYLESRLTTTHLLVVGNTWYVALREIDLVETSELVGAAAVVTVVNTGVFEVHGVAPDLAHTGGGGVTGHVGVGECSVGAETSDERGVGGDGRRCG